MTTRLRRAFGGLALAWAVAATGCSGNDEVLATADAGPDGFAGGAGAAGSAHSGRGADASPGPQTGAVEAGRADEAGPDAASDGTLETEAGYAVSSEGGIDAGNHDAAPQDATLPSVGDAAVSGTRDGGADALSPQSGELDGSGEPADAESLCPPARPSDGSSCTTQNFACTYDPSVCVCARTSGHLVWQCLPPEAASPVCPTAGGPNGIETGDPCGDSGAPQLCRKGNYVCACNLSGSAGPANTWTCLPAHSHG